MAAYGRAGDYFRFYEINPAVEEASQKYFTYLRDSPAKFEVALGDARLSLEHERPQEFDLLVLDAFSSDSIPVHLLTTESFEIYARHLKPGGLLAFHISNLHLDMAPVVLKLADHFNWAASIIDHDEGPEGVTRAIFSSTWILASRDKNILETDWIRKRTRRHSYDLDHVQLWTDDKNNIFQILR